jgi:antitoxin VapB
MARAKVFKHGGSQAVRLPKEFRFEVEEVEARREGDAVILRPRKRGGPDLWKRIDAIGSEEDHLEYSSQPVLQERDFDW